MADVSMLVPAADLTVRVGAVGGTNPLRVCRVEGEGVERVVYLVWAVACCWSSGGVWMVSGGGEV
jgi:hypothetical protein